MRRLFLVVLAVAGAVAGPDVDACAPAPRMGESVAVVQEEALIVWDAATHREHFIRRADFETTAKDFGFLVPTPGRPELAEADDDVFMRLRAAIQPEYRFERRWRVQPTALVLLPFLVFSRSVGDEARAPMLTTAAPPVQVLEQKRVAGFDAAVLLATDTRALARWLESHGYAWRPALATWIAPYVERGYAISAFKIAPAETGTRVGTQALRMTFETEAPFFPYREPADTPSRVGGFRAFVVTEGRVTPRLGPSAVHAGVPWGAKTPYARQIRDASALLAGTLPGAPGVGLWLTSFEDTSAKRRDADLWFTPSPDKTEIVPPPIVSYYYSEIPLPLDVILGLGVLVAWLVVRRSRRRRLA